MVHLDKGESDEIEFVRRSSSVQAARGAERRCRWPDARLDEHSAGSRLHPDRWHPGRHGPVHGPLAAYRFRDLRRHLVVSADSATAAIFSGSLSRMAPIATAKYMALVGMVALLTAGLLLLARVFKLGFLADFLSRTVLVGFLTGVGIQVSVAMLGSMLGLDVASHRTLGQLWEIAREASSISVQSAGLSIFIVAIILLGRNFAPRFPVSLVVVVGTITASAWLHLGERGFAVIGPVPGGLPSLNWPDVGWLEALDLLPVAASCHDHRAKRGNIPGLCDYVQGARRRERGY